MLRRLTACLASLAAAVATLPALANPAVAAPPIGVPKVDVPHWSIGAPSTEQAAITLADGTLSLAASNGGATSGGTSSAEGVATSAASAASAAQSDSTGEWPTGNRDRARTGNAAWEEFITVPAGADFTVPTTDKVQLNPAIVDDVAYFGSAGADRTVYAVDLQTGSVVWATQVPGSVLSSPTVSDGFVYVGAADGRIYQLAADNGEPGWQFPAPGNVPVGGFIGATALHNGVLFAGSLDGNVYALNVANGKLLWSEPTPEAISAGVTVADGKVLVMSGANEWITAFDEITHAQVWQRHFYDWATATTLGTAASYSATKVFLTGLDSKLHILDAVTGSDAMPPPNLGSWAQNTPVPAAGKVYAGTNDGRVLAFDRDSGVQVWARPLTNSGIVSSPVYAAGLVFASNTDGALYALDAGDGTPTWQYVTGGPLFAPPAIVSNRIVFGSDDHNLYALVPGLPDNRSYAPPPPRSHTYGMQPWQQYSWDPVATSTGNYVYQHTDISLPGRGIPIGFARSYNSLDVATSGPLGYGWTFNANATLTPAAGAVTIRWGDGRTDGYTGTGPTYTPPPDGHDTLTAMTGGGWELETVAHLRYRFDPTGKLTTILDASGNQTALSYDGTGRLVTLSDASAHTLTLGYDTSNRITTVTDPLGRAWTYTYSPAGDLATAADNGGNTWRYGYDTAHHLETLHDPDNNLVIDNTYDAQGRVIDQVDSAGGHWAYTYNATSTVVTDPLGHATTYTFDADYRTTAVTDALAHTTRWIYDARSNLVATVDATGRASQFHYNANGNLTAALDPLGHKTAFAYDTDDNLVSITNLKGQTASFAYDSANRLTDTTTPAGLTTHVTYRSDGLIDTITDAAGNTTTYGYTPTGMPLTVTDPLSRVTQVAVDAAGQVTSTTDPLLRVTGYGYTPTGRLSVITDPAGNTVRYGYDNTGRTTSYTDQNNHTTSYTYDGRGLLTATTDPLGRVDRVGYDLARRATTSTNARNQTTTVTYDNADRPVGLDYPAGTPDVTSTLDGAGRPLTATDGTGTTTYTYDTGGRLVSEHRNLANATFAYRYDMLNRRSRLSLVRNGGLTARNTYTYDPDGRLSVLTDSAGGETRFSYDTAGRVATVAHPNAVAAAYAYDAASQITDIATTRTATTGAGSLISSYHYGYDNGGQRTTATRTVAGSGTSTNTYAYDPLGRLTAATSTDPTAPPDANATWAYDNAGNRTRQAIAGAATTNTYTYDPADQLTTDGTYTYTWDLDGNLTTRRTALGGSTLATYTWDPANRITTQTTPDQTTSYAYDGGGRRVTKTDPTGTSTYLYDGGDLLEELTTAATGGDAVETTAGGTVLNRITATGVIYLHPDANANVGELTNANGALQARNAYAPWGKHTTTNTGSATDPYLNRHTFAGAAGVRDDNGGLTDMRNRMYDPTIGGFISRDPLEATTHEPYRYVGGNPISGTDPYGLWCIGDLCTDGVTDAISDAAGAVGGFIGDHADDIAHVGVSVATGVAVAAGVGACAASVVCAGAVALGGLGMAAAGHAGIDRLAGNDMRPAWEYLVEGGLDSSGGVVCGATFGTTCTRFGGFSVGQAVRHPISHLGGLALSLPRNAGLLMAAALGIGRTGIREVLFGGAQTGPFAQGSGK